MEPTRRRFVPGTGEWLQLDISRQRVITALVQKSLYFQWVAIVFDIIQYLREKIPRN